MLENPRQSWILDFTPWIPDFEFRVPINSGIPDSLSCIPDSTRKISDIQESGSPLQGRYINMIVNTESITVTRNGKEPIPLYASITTHGETRTRPVQAWVNEEFQTNWSLYFQLSSQPSNKCLRSLLHESGYFVTPLTFLHELGLPSTRIQWKSRFRMAKYLVHTNSSKQMYRFKNVWIRENEALVIRNAGTVYRTTSASQWCKYWYTCIMTA